MRFLDETLDIDAMNADCCAGLLTNTLAFERSSGRTRSRPASGRFI